MSKNVRMIKQLLGLIPFLLAFTKLYASSLVIFFFFIKYAITIVADLDTPNSLVFL